jgi:CobQ-like glutamine amidotransferase family enzyme
VDFNLNADVANIQIIRRRLELCGYQVTVEHIDSDFSISAGEFDFVVIGSPSSSGLAEALADAKKFKTFAGELIEEKSVVLAVSNGLHAFGSIVTQDGHVMPSLDLFDFQTTFGAKQHVTIAAEVSTEFGSVIGIENHNARIALGKGRSPLGKVLFGVGNNAAGVEGYLDENFFGTHYHGPVLALNDNLANEILSRIVERAGGKFEPGGNLSRLDSLSKEARLHLLKRRV